MSEDNYQDEEQLKRSRDPGELKLTDWKQEPSVLDLKRDLQDADNDHQHYISRISNFLDALHVEGDHQPKAKMGRSRIQPKLIRKQAEWRYSSLSEPFLSTEDIFNVDPVTHEDKEAARQNALVLNHQFNKRINKVKFINDFVRTAVNEGTVILRTSWISKEITYTAIEDVYDIVEVPVPNEEEIAQIQMIVEQYQADPISFQNHAPNHIQQALQYTMDTGVPHLPVYAGEEEVERTKVIANHPQVEVCDYRKVIIDPSCKGDIDQANFVIYNFDTSMAELKANPKYKNLDEIQVQNANILASPDTSTAEPGRDDTDFNFSDELRKRISAYEYWGFRDIDGSGKLTPIVATFVGNVMIHLEKNPYPDQKLPFITVAYLPRTRSIYGDPDGALLEDNQKIIGATTRGMIDIMARSANGQQATRKDALDVTNRRKFQSGEDYEFNPNIHPTEAFYMHTFPEIPASAYNILEMQNNEAEALTGVKAFSSGISGNAMGSTATGVRSALDATSKRDLDILRRLSKGIEEIGRKFMSMNSEFLDEPEIVRITNEEFVSIGSDALGGLFDLKLSTSTAEADNQKAEELAYMLQTMGNNLDFSITKLILVDIARLRKMPALAKKVEEYQPEPDPLEQEKQMLEIELLKAQIAETYSNAEQRGSTSVLNQAKTATESVKSGHLQSQTSRNVLDFVEQESGVKQARDIEKQQAQAEGNMKLETLKAMLENVKNQGSGNQS